MRMRIYKYYAPIIPRFFIEEDGKESEMNAAKPISIESDPIGAQEILPRITEIKKSMDKAEKTKVADNRPIRLDDQLWVRTMAPAKYVSVL